MDALQDELASRDERIERLLEQRDQDAQRMRALDERCEA
jgi:hypothetical protein